ncbi:Fungal specific transcription factor, partial [Ascosphaera atra]
MPSPSIASFDQEEDEEEMYVKVAEAGRKVLRIYRQLHRVKLVNYTYLATHSLFMAGVMFLYAIWHSPAVRSRLTLEEVDLTILAATSVMGDLIQKCPPAEACRDAFQRMSDTTVRMCLETSGFGSQVDIGSRPRENDSQCNGCSNVTSPIAQPKDIPLPMTSAAHNEKLFAAATTQPEIRYDPNTMDIVVTPTSSYQERPTIPPMPQSQQCASTTEPPFTTAQADDPARSPALFAARTTLPFVESHPLQPQPQRPQQQPQQLKQQQQPQQQPQPFVTQNLIQTPVTCSGPSFQQNAARFAAANPQFRNGTTPASYPFSPQDAVAMTNPE